MINKIDENEIMQHLRKMEDNNKAIVHILRGNDSNIKHLFSYKVDSVEHSIPSLEELFVTYDRPKKSDDKYISRELYDYINFHSKVVIGNNGVLSIGDAGSSYEGVFFTKKQIPPLRKEDCLSLKVKNNILDIEEYAYYKFTNKNGKEYLMRSSGYDMGSISTDTYRGIKSSNTYDFTLFMNLLMGDRGECMALTFYYSRDQIKDNMEMLGFEPGVITIKKGNEELPLYYSKTGEVSPMWHYDNQYEMFTKSGTLGRNFLQGDYITINEKKYFVKEDGNVDIPYGEDVVWGVKYPLLPYWTRE